MNDYDYNGDFKEFEDRLNAAGITSEEFDIGDYVGLTKDELDGLVSSVIARKKRRNNG